MKIRRFSVVPSASFYYLKVFMKIKEMAEKNRVQAEYAAAGMSNRMFVSKYRLYLPSKEELEREVRRLL